MPVPLCNKEGRHYIDFPSHIRSSKSNCVQKYFFRTTTVELGLVPFPVFLDKNNAAKKQFRASLVPATFFIDSGLVLRDQLFGEVSEKVEEEAVKSLIVDK